MDPVEEELPDDLETSDRYAILPHKNDLELGKRLVLDFVEREAPHLYDEVQDAFRRRGAYGRLKQLLQDAGILERWYAFENERTDEALKEWCAENGIKLLTLTFVGQAQHVAVGRHAHAQGAHCQGLISL